MPPVRRPLRPVGQHDGCTQTPGRAARSARPAPTDSVAPQAPPLLVPDGSPAARPQQQQQAAYMLPGCVSMLRRQEPAGMAEPGGRHWEAGRVLPGAGRPARPTFQTHCILIQPLCQLKPRQQGESVCDATSDGGARGNGFSGGVCRPSSCAWEVGCAPGAVGGVQRPGCAHPGLRSGCPGTSCSARAGGSRPLLRAAWCVGTPQANHARQGGNRGPGRPGRAD